MGVKSFINKNLVVIVMVPALVGAHYGWLKLQEMDELVKPEERQKYQLSKIAKDMFRLDRVKAALGLKSE